MNARRRPTEHPQCVEAVRAEAERRRSELDQEMSIDQVRSGEAVPVPDDSDFPLARRTGWLRNTLLDGERTAEAASFARLGLAADAGVLESAVDAAETAGAESSLEKMLCHQLAVAHDLAMKLAYLAQNVGIAPLEMPRLINATSRLMEAFQGGLLTLQRLRIGGQQSIVVQHIQVRSEGDAIVAGQVSAKGGATKHER